MKKIVSIILVAAMIFAAIPAYAELEATYGDFRYQLENGNAVITGYQGILRDVKIPQEINGHPVISIGDHAFSWNQIKSLKLPNTITTIEDYAFSGNQIKSLELPNAVTSIGEGAFLKNQIKSLELPSSVITIGKGAFSENQIEDLKLPNAVTSIEDYVFESNQIKNLELPNAVTSIGKSAFADNQIKSLELPNTITTIGEGAFFKNQIKSLELPNAVTSIGKSAFADNQIKSLKLPNAITTIREGTFSGNQIKSLELPNAVTSIGKSAFAGNQIKSLELPNTITTIGKGAFLRNQIENLKLLNTITTIGASAFSRNQIENLKLPNSITTIQNHAFSWNQIKSLELPNAITTIGAEAFSQNQIENIEFPSSITSIGENAFSGNYFLSENAQIIFQGDFSNKYTPSIFGAQKDFNSLEWIIFKEGHPFNWYNEKGECIDLNKAQIPKGVYRQTKNVDPSIPSEKPDGSDKFEYEFIENDTQVRIKNYRGESKKVIIPSMIEGKPVTVIGQGAFVRKSLTSVKIPDSVRTIEKEAFLENELTEAIIGRSVESIGEHAFVYNFLKENSTIKFESDWKNQNNVQIFDKDIIWQNKKGEIIDLNGSYVLKGEYRKKRGIEDCFYSFTNSPKYFLHGYQISDKYRKILEHKLQGHNGLKTKFEKVQKGKWEGSCFGMSIFRAMYLKDLVDIQKYGATNSILRALPRPDNNVEVESIINYLHLAQFLPERSIEIHADIKGLVDACQGASLFNPIYVDYIIFKRNFLQEKYVQKGGHAILVINCEQGVFNEQGKEYTHKLTVLDPNFNTHITEIFVHPNQKRWIYLTKMDSKGNWINGIGYDVNNLGKKYAVPATYTQDWEQFIPHLNNEPFFYKQPVLYIHNYSSNKDEDRINDLRIRAESEENFRRINDYPLRPVLGTTADGMHSEEACVLLPTEETYHIKPKEDISEVDLFYLGENYSFDIQASQYDDIVFNPKGSLEIRAQNTAVQASLIMEDNTKVLEKFSLDIHAPHINELKLRVDEENKGVIIEGDNLKDITVFNSDFDLKEQIKFSTEQKKF